jgi:peptidoglycan/xylan/chitin deacetylase (PgdA/CDA1 family)
VQPLDWFGRLLAPRALAILRRGRPRWLTILAYHRVLPAPGRDYPFDRDVIDCGPAEFEQHMRMVAATCTPVGLGDVIGFLTGGRPLPPNPVLVTFDDGYRDNREHAQPILERHGIPAVFFVTTGNVTERQIFWWDRVAYLFHTTRVAVARISYPTQILLRPRTDGGRARRTVLRLIKTCPGLDVDRFLDGLARALRVDWDPELERRAAAEMLMTWDDVRALAASGMEIGSHTCSHRVLHTLPPDQLRHELTASRADIEREIGRQVRAISYPVGRSLRMMPSLVRAVRDAGYQVGFSAEPRANPVNRELDRFDLARLPVDTLMSREQLGAFLAAPELCRAW